MVTLYRHGTLQVSLVLSVCLAICLLAIVGVIALVVLHAKEISVHVLLNPVIGLASLIWTSYSIIKQLLKTSK